MIDVTKFTYYLVRPYWWAHFHLANFVNRKNQATFKGNSRMTIEHKFEKDPVPVFIGYEGVDADLRAANEELYRAEFDPSHFPFYIVSKNKYCYKIEVHVPGYKQDELDLRIDGDIMSVVGKRVLAPTDMEVVYDGVKQPVEFNRHFRLADNLVIQKIYYGCGVLTVLLKVMFVNEREG